MGRALFFLNFLLYFIDGRDKTLPPAKADNSAVFVGSCFSLLSGERDYRIAHIYEIVDWDRLTDSLISSAREIGHDTKCLY